MSASHHSPEQCSDGGCQILALMNDLALMRAKVEAGLALADEIGCFTVGEGGRCTDLIGGTFQNGKVWTEAMCCLPCRLRTALGGTA
jgi:hypothetical protein